jgi:hypothetical protein
MPTVMSMSTVMSTRLLEKFGSLEFVVRGKTSAADEVKDVGRFPE